MTRAAAAAAAAASFFSLTIASSYVFRTFCARGEIERTSLSQTARRRNLQIGLGFLDKLR